MLDHNELRKYFTKAQQEDIMHLEEICTRAPPGRIRLARLRKPKPGHIPRPVNSFMSYRTEKQSIIRKFCPTANHREISKIVAKWWHNAAHDEKAIFISKAAAAKDAHAEKYPDYIFRPKAKKPRKTTAIAIASVDLDTKKAKKDKCKPFWTHETPFQATHMQENDPNFFYEDAILFGDNDNIWSNTQGDYAYAGNQFPTLPSQCYTQSVPQYSTPQTNPTMADFDVTLDTNFFDPILPTANTSSSNTVQQYLDSNANSLINSSSFAFRTNNELQQHVSLSRLYLPNATPGSQALETPLLDYFQSPATHQPFDSSLLTAQNTPATHDTPINTNTLSFQMDDYYKFFTDSTNGNGTNNSAPSSSSDMTSKPLQSTNSENYINLEYGHSSNGLLFNDTSVWEGFTN